MVIDAPAADTKPITVVFYALPNGSTIEQTAGRRPKDPTEWKFDIQHIAAQTRLLRTLQPDRRIELVYLEAPGLSWPSWLHQHGGKESDVREAILRTAREAGPGAEIVLAAHSGGGSLLLDMLDDPAGLPAEVSRLALLDADYNYSAEQHHGEKITRWLNADAKHRLCVLAYDDRTVTLDGKPIVSPTGGTYRATERMLADLMPAFGLKRSLWLDFDEYADPARRVVIDVNRNYANKILHTALVGDMNGFLYAMTTDTPLERAWGRLGPPRVYTQYIYGVDGAPPSLLPARRPDAIGGATFMRRLAALSLPDREPAILEQLKLGNIPDFLRCFRRVTVHERDTAGNSHTLVYEIAPDYLSVGSDDDFYRIPMARATAEAAAALFDCVLPTGKMVDQIYAAAEVKLAPRPLAQERDAVTTYVQHNTIIEEQRTGIPLGPIVAGIKKDIVITNRLREQPNKVAIYGWHRLDGVPIQPLTTVHAATYADYSHGVRLIRRHAELDGKPVDLRDLLADPVLAPLISDEGPIRLP
jgi:hypothetical protein